MQPKKKAMTAAEKKAAAAAAAEEEKKRREEESSSDGGPTSPEGEEEEGEVNEGEADVPAIRTKRKRKTPVAMTEEVELRIKEFLKANPMIYVKGNKEYRNTQKKSRLWDDLSKDLNMALSNLKTWYDSVRTKVGKIMKTKSGSATKVLTDRDQFLVDHFQFQADHIAHVKPRAPFKLTLKLAGASSGTSSSIPPPSHDTGDGENDDEAGLDLDVKMSQQSNPSSSSHMIRPPPPLPGVRPKTTSSFSKASSSKLSTSAKGEATAADEMDIDVMQSNLNRQQRENDQLESRITGLLNRERSTTRESWGSWLGSLADDLDYRVLPGFYRRTFEVAMDCLAEHNRLREQPMVQHFVPLPPNVGQMVPASTTAYVPSYDLVDQQQQVPPPPPVLFPLQPSSSQQFPQDPWNTSNASSSHHHPGVNWNTPAPTAGEVCASRPIRPASTPNMPFRMSDVSLMDMLPSPSGFTSPSDLAQLQQFNPNPEPGSSDQQ